MDVQHQGEGAYLFWDALSAQSVLVWLIQSHVAPFRPDYSSCRNE